MKDWSAVLSAIATGLMAIFLWSLQNRTRKLERKDELSRQLDANKQTIERLIEKTDSLSSETAKLTAATKVLLRSSLQEDHRRLVAAGSITSAQLRDFNEAMEIYVSEGGNGASGKWKRDVMNLPLVDDKEDI